MLLKIALGLTLLYIMFLIFEHYYNNYARKKIKHVIHVNGTRGKSTVTRLIGTMLRKSNIKTLTKVTGTIPVIIDEEGNEQIIKDSINAMIPEQTIAGDLELPLTHELLTEGITWVSSNEAVITSEGVVTYGNANIDVELTYTFKIGETTYSETITVTVLEPAAVTVSEIILNGVDGEVVLVEGIVAGFHWNGASSVNPDTNGIILKDTGTNNDVLYVVGLYDTYGTAKGEYVVGEHTLAKGDKIKFAATYSLATSSGHLNRKTLTIESVESANLTLLSESNVLNYDLTAATEIANRTDLENLTENLEYGKLYKLSGEFGFRGSTSAFGSGVNLQTGFNVAGISDVNFDATWEDSRPQRFSFKFDNIAMNLGSTWYTDLLGLNSETYTGTSSPYMNYEADSYIYFYVGHALPRATSANGYIQLTVLEAEWISATLKVIE